MPEFTRRDLLAGAAAAGSAGVAGCSGLFGDGDAPSTESVGEERARRLAEAYAPDLFFGAAEQWFPTDPRRYGTGRDGDRVVDGFDALDGYVAEFEASGAPPAPTVFYNVRRYTGSSLAAVQFWCYSVFDQFSVNFHWHDWEVLHVFVDTDAGDGDDVTGEPVLFVASAHARKVPNNEFLDPATDRASVIAEVGSHSSALGVNETRNAFERLPVDGDIADINNGLLSKLDLPAAYGLPRDEGFGLPFSLPELDGAPLFDHPKLPNVEREHFVPPELTVREYASLPSPPADLPTRSADVQFAYEGRSGTDAAAVDHTYALAPMSDVDVDELVGPQLSFEFAVPRFAENAVASHLTSTDVPQSQPRFTNPLADVTDPDHRSALASRFDVDVDGPVDAVVAVLREATGTDDAPGSNGVATSAATNEGVALLESDPTAAPTFNGVVALRGVPSGDHRLTVNAAGVAPHSQRFSHDGDSDTAAGVGDRGEVVVTPNEDAVKLRVDASGDDAPTVASLAVEDDFAGAVYAGEPPGEDRFGVYVHREGAYTAEIEDADGVSGAYRVNPAADQSTATIPEPRTGKASLTDFLTTYLTETFAQAKAFEDGDADGVDAVEVADDTAETAGKAVEEILNATSTATDDAAGSVGDAVDGVTGGVGNATGGSGDGTATTTDGVGDAADSVETAAGTVEDGIDDSLGGDGTETQTATATPTATQTETATGSTGTATGTDDGLLDDADALQAGGLLGLLRALEAAAVAATRAQAAAANGNADAANRRLRALRKRLVTVASVLERNRDDVPGKLPALVETRLPQLSRRVSQAIDAPL
ncbi:hypothetical protein [Halobaculum sp. D14]|uniref:hypothetical protein n=1 Tax=Halobaculum sp. D14 TaxID=3421642 RepID=UPI003EBA0001